MDPLYAASGSKVWGTDLNESSGGNWDGYYLPGDPEYLLSPVINCAGHTGVYLQFKRWLTSERSNSDVARILVNGTEIWRNDRYTNLVDETWQPMLYNIDALAANNPSVQMRFELNTNGWYSMSGWNIDDFRVIATENSPAAVKPAPAAGLIRLSAQPNPFSHLTVVQFNAASAGEARVQLFDAQGRLVRTLLQGKQGAGLHRIYWTGSDDAGRPSPAGTYFCRAEAGGSVAVTRLVLAP